MIGSVVVALIVDDAGDFADRDAPALPCQQVAAARAAHAGENPGADQLLQDLFEIAFGDALTPGDLAALYRLVAGVIGDIEHRFDGVTMAIYAPPSGPVEPKPPSPLGLSVRAPTWFQMMRLTGAITSWAMRMPRLTVKEAAP